MGQYYTAYLKREGTRRHAFSTYVDGNYMCSKLMEQSWWLNPYVNAIAKKIYKNPAVVAWVGDYADDAEDSYGNPVIPADTFKFVMNTKNNGVKSTDFTLDGKFLLNHDKNLFIDCAEYFELSKFKWNDSDDGFWCIHPLPLLTAVGNGLGGGDYNGLDMGYIGSWAFDRISVEDKAPEGFYAMMPTFKE